MARSLVDWMWALLWRGMPCHAMPCHGTGCSRRILGGDASLVLGRLSLGAGVAPVLHTSPSVCSVAMPRGPSRICPLHTHLSSRLRVHGPRSKDRSPRTKVYGAITLATPAAMRSVNAIGTAAAAHTMPVTPSPICAAAAARVAVASDVSSLDTACVCMCMLVWSSHERRDVSGATWAASAASRRSVER